MEAPLLDAEVIAELTRACRIADGERVKARRVSLNFTQAQVAQLAGINVSSYCRVECGTYTPRDDHKVRIAAALASEVADLWHPLSIAEARARAINVMGTAA